MRTQVDSPYHHIAIAEEVVTVNRMITMVFAAMMPLAFFVPFSGVPAAASASGQVFVVDRIEEGIAALCSEDGMCYFLPEAVLGQPLEAGSPVALGAALVQNQQQERRARLQLKVGDLLDDM